MPIPSCRQPSFAVHSSMIRGEIPCQKVRLLFDLEADLKMIVVSVDSSGLGLTSHNIFLILNKRDFQINGRRNTT